MDYPLPHSITPALYELDKTDAWIIGWEIQRLTQRYLPGTRERIKQHKRAIPLAKRLKKLFPDKSNMIIKNLYEYTRRKQDKILSAERGLYIIGEKEACAIGGHIGYRISKGSSESIMMAAEIFRQIPCTFLGKMIKYREKLEFECAWDAAMDSAYAESYLNNLAMHHNAVLLLKAIQRNIEFINDERQFKRALKEIEKYSAKGNV